MNTKEKRNAQVLSMHNNGETVRQIAEKMNISKSAVHKILNAVLIKDPETTQEQKIEPSPVVEEKGKRFSSFVGWTRIDVNTYANKESGEVVKVKFIKAKNPNECGHFITT